MIKILNMNEECDGPYVQFQTYEERSDAIEIVVRMAMLDEGEILGKCTIEEVRKTYDDCVRDSVDLFGLPATMTKKDIETLSKHVQTFMACWSPSPYEEGGVLLLYLSDSEASRRLMRGVFGVALANANVIRNTWSVMQVTP